MSTESDPELDAFARRIRKELVPKIAGSAIFISLVPDSRDRVDVKFAVELGVAIMFDKPILAVIMPGAEIPPKLARVVDRIVRADLNIQSGRDELSRAIASMLERFPGGREPETAP